MKRIGILDSGIGGLTLLKGILNHHFDADYFYISDNKNVPYGNKSQDFMLERIRLMVTILLDKNVDAIVIACNTATAETIDKLRSDFTIPFFGIEPYINYLNHSEDKELALILTEATFKSARFQALLQRFDSNNKLKIYPLKELALAIESLKTTPFFEIEKIIESELNFLNENKFDALILGCTHYPIIKGYIENHYKIKTVDPTENIIKNIKEKLSLEVSQVSKQTFQYNEDASNSWIKISLEDFPFFESGT